MSWSRVLSTSVATLSVVGCAALVVGMHSSGQPTASSHDESASATYSAGPTTTIAPPTLAPVQAVAAATASLSGARSAGAARSSAPVVAPTTGQRSMPTASPPPSSGSGASTHQVLPAATVAVRSSATHVAAPASKPTSKPAPKPAPVNKAAPAKGSRLPLGYSTGSATRVLTVTAHSAGSTIATLQAWERAAGGGWIKVGSAITAHIGADGMSTHPSESRSATPMGTFTLTQAFGFNGDPGTTLPYFRTTPADYWISDEGSTYNTHQRCPSDNTGCDDDGYNERLYYERPYYAYAVVIDYNTANAPGGVQARRGSAFFLHVYPAGTGATAGCVSIPQSRLVPIMRWLTPSAHPRILIGTV